MDEQEIQFNPAAPKNEIKHPNEILNDLLAESSPNHQVHQVQRDNQATDDSEKKAVVYPIWIHKADYKPITQEEYKSLKCDMMRNFLSLARNGDLTIDFRFTSKFPDLKSGKMKLTSESPEAAEAIKQILAHMPFWKVLAAEDLNKQEGKTIWVFCPAVCHNFLLENSLNELIRSLTGWFLEPNDIKPPSHPKKSKIHPTTFATYLFLSCKAQPTSSISSGKSLCWVAP